MRLEHIKRSLSALLAVIMVFTMLPVQAFAAEAKDHVHSMETEPVIETTEGVASETMAVTFHNSIPVQTDAAETEPQASEEETEPLASEEETEPVEQTTEAVVPLDRQLQEQADALLLKHLGSTELSEKELRAAVYAMPDAALYSCRAEIEAMIPQLKQLTEAQLQSFAAENPVFAAFADAVMADRSAGSKAPLY